MMSRKRTSVGTQKEVTEEFEIDEGSTLFNLVLVQYIRSTKNEGRNTENKRRKDSRVC